MGQTVSECKPTCNVADPVSHTVKVDPTLLGGHPSEALKAQMPAEVDQAQEQEHREAEERRRLEEEGQEKERLQREAEEDRLRQEAEEEAIRQEAEAKRRAEEEAETQRKEALLEIQRLAQEESERVAAAERAKAESQAAAAKAEVEAAQKSVDDFLKGRGFKNMLTPRKAFCGASIFPLHLAVEENNAETVRSLLRCGADKTQKNSAKMSPLELAEKCNKKGSHDAIVELLKA